MREYKIRDGVVLEFRDGAEFREVSPEHQGYLAWLDDGNTPEELPPLPEPPQPSLDEEKAAAIEEVRIASERVRVKYYPTGKELDIRRGAPGYTQAHLDVLDSFLDGTLNTVANQAATEIESAPDLTTLRDILSGYRALYAQELA